MGTAKKKGSRTGKSPKAGKAAGKKVATTKAVTRSKAKTAPTAKRAASPTRAKAKPKAKAKPSAQVKPVKSGNAPMDWRGQTLARMRALILEADPEMIEERKWAKASNQMQGVPVWSHHGIVCTGETYKKVVKLTFAQGASLPDPTHLFNSSLEGGTRRAIDVHEGEQVDERAFKALINVAVAQNALTKKR